LRSSIVSVFEAAKAVKPGKPLLVASGGTLAYGALAERAARMCALFEKNGVTPGTRAIVSSEDDIEAVSAFLGCMRSAVTPVMIDPRLPEREFLSFVAAAKAGCAFVDPGKKNLVPGVPRLFEVGWAATKAGMLGRLLKKDAGALPPFLEGVEPVEPPGDIDERLDAYVMFTSGTTSRPKGVRISHRALFAHLATLSRQFAIDEGSRILNVLPLSHADGLVQGPVSALFNRATAFRPFDFRVQTLTELLDAVYRERITHFVAVPSMLAIINRLGQGHEDSFTTGDLKAVVSTAGYLEKGLWEGFEKKFKVRVSNVYGLTETVAGALFSGPGDSDHRPGTVGKPVDCEALIALDDGSAAPDGTAGELLLRGDNLMTGYFEDLEATAEVLEGGWLHTGDIASRDPGGFFTIDGRKKNIIISGGLNIQPEEVSEALAEHPEVAEAVTFGVADQVFGEVVVSCVVLVPGSSTSQDELAGWCKDRLAYYKVPQRVHIFAELPKGRSGKVVVEEAKKMADGAGVSGKKAGGGVRERVLLAAAETFRTPVCELSEFSTTADIAGWDSLAHLQFVVALEEAFGVRLDPSDIIRMDSIGEAERVVRAKLQG